MSIIAAWRRRRREVAGGRVVVIGVHGHVVIHGGCGIFAGLRRSAVLGDVLEHGARRIQRLVVGNGPQRRWRRLLRRCWPLGEGRRSKRVRAWRHNLLRRHARMCKRRHGYRRSIPRGRQARRRQFSGDLARQREGHVRIQRQGPPGNNHLLQGMDGVCGRRGPRLLQQELRDVFVLEAVFVEQLPELSVFLSHSPGRDLHL